MSYKRDYSDLDDGEIPEEIPAPPPKRAKQRPSKSSRQHQNSDIDPTWGQKYVFSGQDDATTIPIGEESDFEDDADAMAYLMSVRQEAYGIPHLLVAPKVQIGPQLPAELKASDNDNGIEPVGRSIYRDSATDSRGWYEDGAYMARPDPEEPYYDEAEALEDDDDELTEKQIHEAYFSVLSSQFMHIRQAVRATPPPHAKLSPGTPTFAAAFDGDTRTTRKWSAVLRKSDPHPVQVSRLSKDSVMRILRIILGGKFLRQGYPIEERTSRWLWALLARLPERGELDFSEIGWIRDLGRRAVLLGRSLAEMAALREDLEEGGLGVHEGVDASSSDEDAPVDDEAENPDILDNLQAAVAASKPKIDPEDGDDAFGAEHQQPNDTALSEAIHDEVKASQGASGAVPSGTSLGAGGEDRNYDLEAQGDVDDEDVAMELASNSSADEAPMLADLDDAKARLLERLAQDDHIDAEEAARERSRMNMRATLNMILTVAGEFYGQRDLLEFREPFVGL